MKNRKWSIAVDAFLLTGCACMTINGIFLLKEISDEAASLGGFVLVFSYLTMSYLDDLREKVVGENSDK